MDHAPRVGMRDGGPRVPDDGQRVGAVQRVRPSRRQHLAQQHAAQVFHREEGQIAVAVEFMNTHDVRMRQGLQMLEFAAQFGEQPRPFDHLGVEDLSATFWSSLDRSRRY